MHTFFIATQKSNPHTKRWTFHSPESICQITLFRFVFFFRGVSPPRETLEVNRVESPMHSQGSLRSGDLSSHCFEGGRRGEDVAPLSMCVCVCFEKKEALWNLHMICI